MFTTPPAGALSPPRRTQGTASSAFCAALAAILAFFLPLPRTNFPHIRAACVGLPETVYFHQAEAKDPSASGRSGRGAKGAKGSRSGATPAAADGSGRGPSSTAVARGTFSVQISADADAKTGRRSSGFQMADAKSLTRALAKGIEETRRRRDGVEGVGGERGGLYLPPPLAFSRRILAYHAGPTVGEFLALRLVGPVFSR